MSDPEFDPDLYFDRLGYRGPREPTARVLGALCAAHPAAIPFENIDPLLGRVPRLGIREIQAKLVGQHRGGYCFEHNALLRQGLLALGFSVTSLAARVVWRAPPGLPTRPRTHMLLLVDLAGDRWLVDGGFGGHLMNLPLALVPGPAQSSPAGRLRVVQDRGVFAIDAELPDGWWPLYRFTLEPQLPADYEPLNWFTATHPASIFRHNLLMERLTPTLRANLLNDRLTLRAPGAAAQTRQLADAGDFEQVLTEVFGVTLPVPAAELFDRVPRGRDGMVLQPP